MSYSAIHIRKGCPEGMPHPISFKRQQLIVPSNNAHSMLMQNTCYTNIPDSKVN